jgi:hypothetical protein
MNDERQRAKKKKSKRVRGILVLLIYVQSVRMPVGYEDDGRWNRERKEN